MSKARANAGFSMLEFTNGLSAFALLVTAGLSGVYDFIVDVQRSTVVNQMLMGFRVARSAANQFATTVTVCPSADGRTCSGNWTTGWLAFVDRDGDGEMAASERRGVVAKALNEAAGVAVASDFDRFSFAPGSPVAVLPNDASATVCIRDFRGIEQSRVIWIDARGYAELHAQRPPREQAENAARDFSRRSTDCF